MRLSFVILFNIFAIAHLSLAASVRSRSTCKAKQHSHKSTGLTNPSPSQPSQPTNTPPAATVPGNVVGNSPTPQPTNTPQPATVPGNVVGNSQTPLSSSACKVTQWSQFAPCLSASEILISSLAVPGGKTLDFTNVNPGTHIRFEGTTSFECHPWVGPLVRFTGNNLVIDGNGTLDGNGKCYWDGLGSNAGASVKPFFFQTLMLNDSTVSGITLLNTPKQSIQIQAHNVIYSGITIDDRAGAGPKGGHNTDGFIIASSSDITISGCTVYNQDDCVAVDSGTDILVTGMQCQGGNGLAIGGVGFNPSNDVRNVRFEKSTLVDTNTGVQIKTIRGAVGSVSNVTYADITFQGVTGYGVSIEQDFLNPGPTGDPTNGVTVSDIKFHGITGTLGQFAYPFYMICGGGSCTNIVFEEVNLTGGRGQNKCINFNFPAGSNNKC